MKNSTIEKYIKILKEIKESGKSIKAYCDENGIKVANLYQVKNKIANSVDKTNELYNEFLTLYNEILTNPIDKDIIPYSELFKEEYVESDYEESDELAPVTIIRDNETEKIVEYKINVKVRDSKDFEVTLSRKEAEDLFGLYTYYGGNITARNVANEFPKYTFSEVKKLLRAFKITKDSVWYPPHLGEEMSIEELNQYRMNLKERAAFKYADSRRELDYNKTIKDLSDRLKKAEGFNDVLQTLMDKEYQLPQIYKNVTEEKDIQYIYNGDTLILFLSDMHIGAKVDSNSLFPNKYDLEEVKNRIRSIIEHLTIYGTFKEIVVVNLGDSIDGFDNTTSRRSQIMPQNLNNLEQVNGFVDSIMYLFSNMIENNLANDYSYISVKCGNHPGDIEWIINKLICYKLKEVFGNYINETLVGDSDYVSFQRESNLYICAHGRDAQNMRSHMPLNLDTKWENMLTDYIFHTYSISPETRINVVSGDLHNEAMNRGKFFKYWKVGSLFGASDYCMANYGNTPPHINYHIIKNNNILSGTIEL